MANSAYLEHLRADGEALAAVARKAPDVAVPSCPEWDMTALVGHVGEVHRWVDLLVSTRAAAYLKGPDAPSGGPDATLRWYEEGLAQLLGTLGAADAGAPVWNWQVRAPAPVGFWLRRMANETAVHRWDAEAAAGVASPIAADLAVDGINEYLSFVELWLARRPVEGLSGSLHLHATDIDGGEWSLNVSPDGMELRREHAKSDAAIRGPVSDLLLWMLNRVPPESASLQVFGAREIVGAWRQLQF